MTDEQTPPIEPVDTAVVTDDVQGEAPQSPAPEVAAEQAPAPEAAQAPANAPEEEVTEFAIPKQRPHNLNAHRGVPAGPAPHPRTVHHH